VKKYGVILADPPWQYSNSGIHGAADNHYPTMTDDDIIGLGVKALAATDSVLLMWSNWAKQDVAMDVIKAWGYKYKTGFPWIKLRDVPTIDLFGKVSLWPAVGQGWWVQGVTEPFLIATRGNPPNVMKLTGRPPVGLGQLPGCLISLRFQHSRKPSNQYEYAELFPGPYVELFARETRLGWDVWGNEVESTVKIG